MSDQISKPKLSAAEAAEVVFNLRAEREARKYITLDHFLQTVEDQKQNFNAPTFRKLCLTAIAHGLTSSQDIVKNCGDVIPRNTKRLETEWSLPAPAKCREILNHFATLNPSNAIPDNRLPWRHEQCAQPEAAQALPNLPRRVAGRQLR